MRPIPFLPLAALLVGCATGATFAMGPDPGGHTGATVTPETTRTDRPTVDSARKSASGANTETNRQAGEEPKNAGKK